jgi:hypothetical protein
MVCFECGHCECEINNLKNSRENKMNEETFLMYEHLEKYLNHAEQVCDPLDFQIRQRALLLKLADTVLTDYRKEKFRRESASSHENSSCP